MRHRREDADPVAVGGCDLAAVGTAVDGADLNLVIVDARDDLNTLKVLVHDDQVAASGVHLRNPKTADDENDDGLMGEWEYILHMIVIAS